MYRGEVPDQRCCDAAAEYSREYRRDVIERAARITGEKLSVRKAAAALRAERAKRRPSDAKFTAFLEGRVAEWYRHDEEGWGGGRRIPLLEYLGMTRDEYGDWVTTGIASSRVRRCWDQP